MSRPATPWLPISQAAAILSVHRTTVWRWISDGTIPAAAVRLIGTRHRVLRTWCEKGRCA